CTDIYDIFEELPLPRIAEVGVGHFHHRHAQIMDIIPNICRRQFFGTVIHQIATWTYISYVLIHALCVNCDHKVNSSSPAKIAFFTYPYFVPGRETLDVLREYVFWTYRYHHPEDGFG